MQQVWEPLIVELRIRIRIEQGIKYVLQIILPRNGEGKYHYEIREYFRESVCLQHGRYTRTWS